MPEGHRRTAALATRCTAAQPGHLGVGTGLIDKDECLGIKIDLCRKPSFACGRDVGPLLLGGVRCFF